MIKVRSDTTKNREKMKNITIAVPEPYIDVIEYLRENGYTPSRSECIRTAIQEFLVEEIKNKKLLEGKRCVS